MQLPVLKNVTFLTRFLRCRFNFRMLTGHAVTYKEYGDPESVLELCNYTVRDDLGEKDVLIKMIAAPINPADINMVQGKYAILPKLPAIGGNEGVGEVLKVGSSVSSLKVGDRVIPSEVGQGTWKTHEVCSEDNLTQIDNSLSPIVACSIKGTPTTAYRMLLDFVDLKEGDTVIQNGANSAVGQSVIQIAKLKKVNTVNVVRERPDVDTLKNYLYSIGATHVITDAEMRSKQTQQIFQKIPKAILALNCVSGKSAGELTRFMAYRSTMVTYGGMSKQPLTLSTASFIFNDIRFRGYWMTQWYKESSHEERTKMLNDLISMVKQGHLQAPSYEEVKLENFKEAVTKSLESYVCKKQILVM